MKADNGGWYQFGEFHKKDGDPRSQAIESDKRLGEAVEAGDGPEMVAVPKGNWRPSKPKAKVRRSIGFE